MKPQKVGKIRDSARFGAEKQLLDSIEVLRNTGYTEEDILNLIKSREGIPITIFANDELSSLETIVKFLKENKNLAFSEIASLLNRDQRTIWTTYNKASKKKKSVFIISESKYHIPFEIFRDRDLGVLENICFYLKNNFGLSFHEIAVLLRRNDRTIWTSYQKAKEKRKK